MEGGVPARCGAAAALAGASAAGRRRRRRGRGARRAHPLLLCCASRSARRSTRDATAAVAPLSAASISGVSPHLCHAAAACTRGTRAAGGAGMQGEENKKDERGGVARVGVAPKEKGVKGLRGCPKALILGQIRQRSRAVLGALSAGAKLGRSGWGVAYPSRALMSPPFLWKSCNVPQHHRDANAACRASRLPSERARK